MFYWRGQWCVNTLWLKHGGVPTQAMCDADRTAIKNVFSTQWRSRADPDCQLRQIKSWRMSDAVPTKFTNDELYPLTTIVGNSAGGRALLGTTCAISLRTGAVGATPKPPHGRLYHVGGPNSSEYDPVTSGIIPATQAAYQTIYDALRTALNGAGSIGTWSLVSYWLGGTRAVPVLRAVPLVLPISHVQMNVRVDFLRSRQPREQAFTAN